MTLPSGYEDGWWSCSYAVSPVEDPLSLPEFRELLLRVKGKETGWPVWMSLEGRTGMGIRQVDGILECWLKDTESSDFWRADPSGFMFLSRRFQEDTDYRDIPKGSHLDLVVTIWRVGECLLHAYRLASELHAEEVELTMSWNGIEGRELRALAGGNFRNLMPGRKCTDDTFSTTISVRAADIIDTLPELVKSIVAPLFARFNFYTAPDEIFNTEIRRMLTGT